MRSSVRLTYAVVAILTICLLAACGSTANNASPAAPKSNTAATSNKTNNSEQSSTNSSPEAEFHVLTDAMGHEVSVPVNPQRILAPFIEDPLTALGVKPVAQWGANLVPQQYLQDKLADVPVLAMDGGLKTEEALSYNPDLIIFLAPSYMPNGAYDTFAQIAPTFVLSDNPADWKGNLEKLGALLNQQDSAKQALATYDAQLKSAKEKLGNLPAEKTAILLQGIDEKGFKLFGPNFFGGQLLHEELGFKQPKLLQGDYELYSVEMLSELQEVDYIFVLSGEGRAKPPEGNSIWKNLPAVKAGHVFEANSGHWFNSNPIANSLMIDDVLRYVQQ